MIVLAKEQADSLIEHAKAETPNECCGLLAGLPNGYIERIYRMANVDRSPTSYSMSPDEQLIAFREMDALGLDLIGIYHSHTHSAAYPSIQDIERAVYHVTYVIISPAMEIKGFRIIDGEIVEAEVIIR
jgi:proteasome lid subunit RPN8/RPN11